MCPSKVTEPADFGYDVWMALTTIRISELILDQLAQGEKRLLVLVVAIRKSLNDSEGIKGDLPTAVKSALRKLIASNKVVDGEGVYSLNRPEPSFAPAAPARRR
jgi:hypothetical protein